jgi:hypothetical protein
MLATLLVFLTPFGMPDSPSATLSNGQLDVKIYLPDVKRGFYRGARFDWSGVIHSLEFKGHDYYGPWFTKTDPAIHDFIYQGDDIIAGPCSAITGPVDEFGPLGWDNAQPGKTFIKIGVGALRKPSDATTYDNFHLYEIEDTGKWEFKRKPDFIEFKQTLKDPFSGYSYVYTKTVQLTSGKAEMVLLHTLKNTGTRAIRTTVYNHNFLVLDRQPTASGVTISVPFQIHSPQPPDKDFAEIQGNKIVYLKTLRDQDKVAMTIEGFSDKTEDHQIRIENRTVGAGMSLQADRPLSSESLWSIRSVLAMEPFIAISIEPGQEFSWKTTYQYFTLP